MHAARFGRYDQTKHAYLSLVEENMRNKPLKTVEKRCWESSVVASHPCVGEGRAAVVVREIQPVAFQKFREQFCLFLDIVALGRAQLVEDVAYDVNSKPILHHGTVTTIRTASKRLHNRRITIHRHSQNEP